MSLTLVTLIDLSEHDHITVQVLPFDAGTHPGQFGNFSILDFPNDDDPGVVYLETRCGGLYLEKNEELYEYRKAFAKVADLALNPEESTVFLRKLARSEA